MEGKLKEQTKEEKVKSLYDVIVEESMEIVSEKWSFLSNNFIAIQ